MLEMSDWWNFGNKIWRGAKPPSEVPIVSNRWGFGNILLGFRLKGFWEQVERMLDVWLMQFCEQICFLLLYILNWWGFGNKLLGFKLKGFWEQKHYIFKLAIGDKLKGFWEQKVSDFDIRHKIITEGILGTKNLDFQTSHSIQTEGILGTKCFRFWNWLLSKTKRCASYPKQKLKGATPMALEWYQ